MAERGRRVPVRWPEGATDLGLKLIDRSTQVPGCVGLVVGVISPEMQARHPDVRPGMQLATIAHGPPSTAQARRSPAGEHAQAQSYGTVLDVVAMGHDQVISYLKTAMRSQPPLMLEFLDNFPGWEPIWNEQSRSHYWYNHSTEESRWDPPTQEELNPSAVQPAGGGPAPLLTDATPVLQGNTQQPKPQLEPEPESVARVYCRSALQGVRVERYERKKDEGFVAWHVTAQPEHCEDHNLVVRFSQLKEFHQQLALEQQQFKEGPSRPTPIAPADKFKGKLPAEPWLSWVNTPDDAFLKQRQGQLQQYFDAFVEWEQKMRSLGPRSHVVMEFPSAAKFFETATWVSHYSDDEDPEQTDSELGSLSEYDPVALLDNGFEVWSASSGQYLPATLIEHGGSTDPSSSETPITVEYQTPSGQMTHKILNWPECLRESDATGMPVLRLAADEVRDARPQLQEAGQQPAQGNSRDMGAAPAPASEPAAAARAWLTESGFSPPEIRVIEGHCRQQNVPFVARDLQMQGVDRLRQLLAKLQAVAAQKAAQGNSRATGAAPAFAADRVVNRSDSIAVSADATLGRNQTVNGPAAVLSVHGRDRRLVADFMYAQPEPEPERELDQLIDSRSFKGQSCKLCGGWIQFSILQTLIDALVSIDKERNGVISEKYAREVLAWCQLGVGQVNDIIEKARNKENFAEIDSVNLIAAVIGETGEDTGVDKEGDIKQATAQAIEAARKNKQMAVCESCTKVKQQGAEEEALRLKTLLCYIVSAILVTGYIGLLVAHERELSSGDAQVQAQADPPPPVPNFDTQKWHECGGTDGKMGMDGVTLVTCLSCMVMQMALFIFFQYGRARNPSRRRRSPFLWLHVTAATVVSGLAAFFTIWFTFASSSIDAFVLITYGLFCPWLVLGLGGLLAFVWIIVTCFIVSKAHSDPTFNKAPHASALVVVVLLAVVIGAVCDTLIDPLSDCEAERWDITVVLGVAVFLTSLQMLLAAVAVPKLVVSADLDSSSDVDEDSRNEDEDTGSPGVVVLTLEDAQSKDVKVRSLCCGLLTTPKPVHDSLIQTEAKLNALRDEKDSYTSTDHQGNEHHEDWSVDLLQDEIQLLEKLKEQKLDASWAAVRSVAGKAACTHLVTSLVALKVTSSPTATRVLGAGVFVPWLLIIVAMLVAGIIHGLWRGVVALLKGADKTGKSVSPLEWWHHFAITLILLVIYIAKFVHDLFEYVPEDNSATTGVTCLVLIFHVALWFILTFRLVLGLSLVAQNDSSFRMHQDMQRGPVTRVLESLHSRRTCSV